MKYSLARKNKNYRVLTSIGLALTIAGITICAYYFLTRQDEIVLEISTETVVASSDSPDERKVDPDASFEVPADHPRRILLDSIAVKGFVQPVGVDQHGAIAVPTNIHIAGWFVDRSSPGEAGLSIIDGHIRGWTESGIFENLDKLKT